MTSAAVSSADERFPHLTREIVPIHLHSHGVMKCYIFIFSHFRLLVYNNKSQEKAKRKAADIRQKWRDDGPNGRPLSKPSHKHREQSPIRVGPPPYGSICTYRAPLFFLLFSFPFSNRTLINERLQRSHTQRIDQIRSNNLGFRS